MNQEKTKEALHFKKLIEDAERAINILMNFQKRRYKISTEILLFDRRVFIFIIEYKIDDNLRYELVAITPEEVEAIPSTYPRPEYISVLGQDPSRFMFSAIPLESMMVSNEPYNATTALQILQRKVERAYTQSSTPRDPWEILSISKKTVYKIVPA